MEEEDQSGKFDLLVRCDLSLSESLNRGLEMVHGESQLVETETDSILSGHEWEHVFADWDSL